MPHHTTFGVSAIGTSGMVAGCRLSPSDEWLGVAGGKARLAIHDVEDEVREDVGKVDPTQPSGSRPETVIGTVLIESSPTRPARAVR